MMDRLASENLGLEIAGWQHALDPCPATGSKRWIFAIAPTEAQAKRDGAGAFSNRECDVRPLYTVSQVAVGASPREVELMVVLEHVAATLGFKWATAEAAKVIEAVADEMTPLFEGLGMTICEGPQGQDCYGFDWTAEQEAIEKELGGRKAIFRRLALETPPGPTAG